MENHARGIKHWSAQKTPWKNAIRLAQRTVRIRST